MYDTGTMNHLFHGEHDLPKAHSCNHLLKPMPCDVIESAFGKLNVTVQENQSVALQAETPTKINTVWYIARGTLSLDKHDEEWYLAQHSYRVTMNEDGSHEVERYGDVTDKAGDKIRKELHKVGLAWVEKNHHTLPQAVKIKRENWYTKARITLADAKRKIEMREEWLDKLEQLEAEGVDIYDLTWGDRLDLYGRYWRF